MSEANELRNKIGTIRLSFQTKDTEYKDQDDYPGLNGNYHGDLNTLLSSYKGNFSCHYLNISNTPNPAKIEDQKYFGPCMLCDNPNLPKFLDCRFCNEIICYCKCNLCNRCYCKCQFCSGPHPESVCIYMSDDSDDSISDDFDASISSGCHTDSNQESLTEYSDLSKTETVTIDEHPFLNAILNIPHPQLINTLTQTDNQMLSVSHVQTQTEGWMMIVDRDEFEVLEKVHALNSYLKGI